MQKGKKHVKEGKKEMQEVVRRAKKETMRLIHTCTFNIRLPYNKLTHVKINVFSTL